MYALLLLQNLDLLFCLFCTSSVILVTDNVTKAAPGFDGTNKAYWDGNVVSQFQACSVLSIVLSGGCLYFTTSGLFKLQSLYRLVLITLHGQTIQDLF
jgi:hypothetical protein